MHFYTLLNSPFPLPSKSLFPFHPSPQAPPHRSPSDIAHQPPTAYQCTSAPTLTQSEPRAPAQGTGRIDAVVFRARHDPKGLGIP
ncbi:hypothetical protein V495_05690 [Pseudogymnoascus sp. VKM F-4514 (FW-929)]|nr:hypothetical protein V495_05690 [Pseudogymnoascus sp. VKM F-4514 (FW-929)]